MTLRRPGAFGGAIAGSIATSFGLRNFVSSSRPCPSGVRIMTMSTRTPSIPLTRSTHGPSIGALPSIVMPSAVKKAMAASRSSTTTLTWSSLLIVMLRFGGICGPLFRRQQFLERVKGFLREALDRVVARDDRDRFLVAADLEQAQEEAHVVLVVKLGPDAEREALHRQQVLGLRHHDFQVTELEPGPELAALAQVALDRVVQPVGLQVRARGDARGRRAHFLRGAEVPVHVLGGGARGIGEAHHGAADEVELARDAGLGELFVEKAEEAAQILRGKSRHSDLSADRRVDEQI